MDEVDSSESVRPGESDRETRAYYDAEARVYDQNRYGGYFGTRADSFHRQVLADLLCPTVRAGERVLEFGCGTGRLLSWMAERDYRLYGVDVSRGMLAVCQERLNQEGHEGVSAALYDGGRLPFDDAFFSAAYAILVINLIPDFRAAFGEVARVLEHGGHFLFNVPNLESLYFPAGLYVNSRGRSRTANAAGGRYSHWFRRGEAAGALRGAGLEIRGVVGQPPWAGWVMNCPPVSGPFLYICKSIYVLVEKIV